MPRVQNNETGATAVAERPDDRLRAAMASADALVAAEQLRAEAADEVVLQLARTRQAPTAGQEVLLRSCGLIWSRGTDGQRLREALNHASRVLDLQVQAGDGKARQAAAQTATEAEQRLAAEGAGIAEQIRELRAKLTTLERDAEQSRQRCTRMEKALEALQDPELLPRSLRTEYDRLQSRYLESAGHRVRALQAEIRLTGTVAAYDVSTLDGHGLAKDHAWPDVPVFLPVPNGHPPKIDALKWQGYIGSRERGDEERRAEIERLESSPEAVALRSRMRELLRHYVPR